MMEGKSNFIIKWLFIIATIKIATTLLLYYKIAIGKIFRFSSKMAIEHVGLLFAFNRLVLLKYTALSFKYTLLAVSYVLEVVLVYIMFSSGLVSMRKVAFESCMAVVSLLLVIFFYPSHKNRSSFRKKI